MDIDILQKFYQDYLFPYAGTPDLSWLILPVARRKYYPELNQSQLNYGREILSAKNLTFESFLNKLEVCQLKITQAKNPKTQQTIPRTAWVFFITANPLNEKKAFLEHWNTTNKKIAELIEGNEQIKFNSISDYKTALHKNPLRKYIKLDVDTKDFNQLEPLKEVLSNFQIRYSVETRGGYHVIVPLGQDLQNLWKFCQKNKDWVTIENISTSPQLAIPGIYQSDWLVKPDDNWLIGIYDQEKGN